MTTHSSILAWRTPWREEPGGLQSMGLQGGVTLRGMDWRWGVSPEGGGQGRRVCAGGRGGTAISTHLNTSHKDGWWHLEPPWFISLEHHVCKSVLISIIGFSHSPHSTTEKAMQSTPVLLPGKSHGQRSLVGCSPWGSEELDMTEQLHFHFSLRCIGEGNGNPLQCSCLENTRDRGSLVGCRLWGHTELDATEAT